MQTICIHSESLARQCACSRVVLSRSVQPCVHMRHTIAPRQRSLQRTQAAGGGPKAPDLSDKNGKATSVIQDSDFAFMGKLLAVSVIGGAAIKYGSLLWSLPFQPDSAVALAVVLGTPAAYSLYLLTQSSKQQ